MSGLVFDRTGNAGRPGTHAEAVDPAAWPDVARRPACGAARAAVARVIVRRALARLPLRVRTPEGTTGDHGPVLHLHDPGAFHRRTGADGLIGFGESYMAGEWDADDLVGVLTVLAAHVTDLVPPILQRLRGAWSQRLPHELRNTPQGARENVHRHYDLSNDLFALFLDETMTYSSALFDALPARWDDLAGAQRRKIDRLLDLAGVGPGTRLLEIGTGWGELALRAARRGARVRTVTLSREQAGLAAQRIARAGLADRVDVEVCDYREAEGRHDAVVSVEMIEAVGEEYWPVYFEKLAALLAPGGKIALQSITMPHDRMLATRGSYSWIGKYIFPGGIIPSPEAIRHAASSSGLGVAGEIRFGEHYAQTLALWRERFTDQAGRLARLGFDPTFRRMWDFYLAYCQAGFRSGYLDVRQMLLTPTPTPTPRPTPTPTPPSTPTAAGRRGGRSR